MIVVKITDRDVEKSQQFMLERCLNVEMYRQRGGFKPGDIMIGALAEIAVYKLLKELGIKTGHPDFSIHENANKSYDADLTDGVYNFHVKGQGIHQSKRYGESWLFQKSDDLISAPKKRHYIVPCVVDKDNKTVFIHACLPAKTAKRLEVFGEAKLPHLRKTKKALYLRDIDDKIGNSREQRWGILNSSEA